MAIVWVRYAMTEEFFKREFVAQGVCRELSIELEASKMTPEQREKMFPYFRDAQAGAGIWSVWLSGEYDHELSVDEAIDLFMKREMDEKEKAKQREVKERREAEERQQKEQEEVTEFLANDLGWFISEKPCNIGLGVVRKDFELSDFVSTRFRRWNHVQAVVEKRERVEEELDRRNRIEEEVAQKEYAVRVADRENWVLTHGSDHLKRLFVEGINYQRAYFEERLAVERPGWSVADERIDYLEDPLSPSPSVIEMLDAARKTAPNAELQYYKPRDGEDGDPYYLCVAEFMGRTIIFTK